MDAITRNILSSNLRHPQNISSLGTDPPSTVKNLRPFDQLRVSGGRSPSSLRMGSSFYGQNLLGLKERLMVKASSVEGISQDLDSPASMPLDRIHSEERFDEILAEAQQLRESLVIVWVASWCRKCIYLKPKLEKLAPVYYPRIRFYFVDVNVVPQRLVSRAGIVKMPTIQEPLSVHANAQLRPRARVLASQFYVGLFQFVKNVPPNYL